MKRFLTAAVAVVAATIAAAAQTGPAAAIDDFFRDFTAEWMRTNPNLAAATRYFTGPEQQALERRLTPLTRDYRQSRVALARKGLEQLKRFERAQMSDDQRVSADLLQWSLETTVEGERFADYSFPLEQMGGANVGLVNVLTVTHPVLNEADARNYLARLGEVAPRMDEAVAEARRLAAAGLLPPRFILTATIAQMRQFVAPDAAQNPFVTAFADKLAAVQTLSDAQRSDFKAQAAKTVAAEVYPAWQRALAVLEPLVEQSTDAAGLSRLKGGADAYAFNLRRFTSTDLTAEAIHQIGLKRVAEIESEMDAIFRRLGRTTGSVKDRIAVLKTDLAYPLTEQGRAQILADVEQMMRDAERRAAPMFDKTPKTPVVARPYPRFREANAAASYNAPAQDGSRPGTFQIPLRPERMTKFGLRTLVYHETVPGHHFQIALTVENSSLPRFRQIGAFGGVAAFSEGWGLYAEKLAAENGWYEGDLEGLLGQLDGELFRARRLVVDTGLHTKGWSRQQAIDYGIEASEVERYVVNPGQACAYMIGQLKIIELRDRARTALGASYSPKEFHNVVLGTGTVPLSILERQVAAYIQRARGSAARR
jgi:uncharacterized protein (DUF885 family)